MNRRQLAFIILFNAIISLVVALLVVWAVEARRPDPEQLAIGSLTPISQLVNSGVPAAEESASTGGTQPTPTSNGDPAPSAPVAGNEAGTLTDTTTAVAPTPVGEQEVYIVATGDSLSSIADRFGIPVSTIVEVNQLTDPNYVFSGQRLLIPVDGEGSTPATPAPPPAAVQAGQGLAIRAVAAPGDLLNEAVQIVNDGTGAVNLAGWQLVSPVGTMYTFADLPLFPGNYVWVHSGSGDDTSIARYWRQAGALWASGAEVQLRNGAGEVITRYTIP